MSTVTLFPESQRYRARAVELRSFAGALHVDAARRRMLKAAEDFDRIAREARVREIAHGISGLGKLLQQLHAYSDTRRLR
jgi:hypothetical protein